MVFRANAGVSLVGVFRAPGSTRDARDPELAQAGPATALPDVTAHELFALVYRQMCKLAGHRDLDELVQVAVEQALRSLPSFQGRSQLSTWTFRLCYLTIKKHDRWYRRWLRRFSFTEDGEVPERAVESDGDDVLARAERREHLEAALDRLSVKQRTVVVLHDLEELSIEEIAEIVEAAPAAIRSRLRDGRRALSRILKADPFFGDEACQEKTTP